MGPDTIKKLVDEGQSEVQKRTFLDAQEENCCCQKWIEKGLMKQMRVKDLVFDSSDMVIVLLLLYHLNAEGNKNWCRPQRTEPDKYI